MPAKCRTCWKVCRLKEPSKYNLENWPLADEISGKAQNAQCDWPRKRFGNVVWRSYARSAMCRLFLLDDLVNIPNRNGGKLNDRA